MKTHLFNFLKGICIGIANVIPGFSGGTMAVMLKIYDLFVYAFANIFNDFVNVIKKCWSLFIGIGVGVLLALVTIVKLLEVIPFITIMFFVGLILGSIPTIYQNSKQGKLKIIDIICLLLAIGVMVALPLIKTNNEVAISYNWWIYPIMLVLGIICSSAMVIPGVSGSLVLMAFGYYAFFMATLKDYLINIFNFSHESYWNMFFIIICFAIGCIIGIVFISKLIIKLTNKYPKTVYFTILGLLLASPFSIIFSTFKEYELIFNVPTIIFSIISLSLGVGIVLLGEHFSKKTNKNNENIYNKD
jgi:putative membrane protein